MDCLQPSVLDPGFPPLFVSLTNTPWTLSLGFAPKRKRPKSLGISITVLGVQNRFQKLSTLRIEANCYPRVSFGKGMISESSNGDLQLILGLVNGLQKGGWSIILQPPKVSHMFNNVLRIVIQHFTY
ncbi:MAG: hypothetical protein IJ111_09950 [Eggerthellaceae bacterium]|nr:hypothetical protein [Eggerthellaceae bacterium]